MCAATMLAEIGAGIGHCLSSWLGLADGVARVVHFWARTLAA